MAEPIPSASTAAVEAANDEEPSQLPANAEDRKAAAALDALQANEMSQDSTATTSKQPSAADQAALGEAMSRLEIASGKSAAKKKESEKKSEESKKDDVPKKKVKIVSEDVNWLMEELDLTKSKATELLRAHEGDAMNAAKEFIMPTTIKT